VYGIVVVYLTIGCAGYFIYTYSNEYNNSFYDLHVTDQQLSESFAIFIYALSFFLFGACYYIRVSKRYKIIARNYRKNKYTFKHEYNSNYNKINKAKDIIWIIIYILPIILIAIGAGIDNILLRTEYLIGEYHSLQVVGSILTLPIMVSMGYSLIKTNNLLFKLIILSYFILYALIFLSMSTRQFVILFLFVFLGMVIAGIKRKTFILFLLIWLLFLPLLLRIPLELREMPKQGLIPLYDNIQNIYSNNLGNYYSSSVYMGLCNLTFGVPLVAYIKDLAPIPNNYLYISINPMPSFLPMPGLLAWSEISDQMRVSVYIPYNALGELINHGYLWLIMYYLLAGFSAAFIDVGARFYEGTRSQYGYLIAAGVFYLFAITSTQYNLRSSTRLIYYAILIAYSGDILGRLKYSSK
jgi:hypothetical protein